MSEAEVEAADVTGMEDGTGRRTGTENGEAEGEPNLSKLLAALALGVRSVNGLPIGEDEIAYQTTYPQISKLMRENTLDIYTLVCDTLELEQPVSNTNTSTTASLSEQDLALLWDSCADACDALLEQAESYLSEDYATSIQHQQLQTWSQTARQQSQHAHRTMLDKLVQDMEKPQQTHGIHPDNARTTPFIPVGAPAASLQTGRAKDTHFGGSPDAAPLPPSAIGPPKYMPHQARSAIEQLERQYPVPAEQPPQIAKLTDKTNNQVGWIDTKEQLDSMVQTILNDKTTQIAMDFEAHSHRSFGGMVCLMQISTSANRHYLVDTLALWHRIPATMKQILSDPQILKVLHGADSDVAWLQRDFGLYIVNLLDTGRAARLLKLPSYGLAYLLQKYVSGIKPDKSHQLSDWRQRPLPDEMKEYAHMDTCYLLQITQHLLWEIQQHSSPDVTIDALFAASQQVAMIRYDKPLFYPEGYQSLLRNTARTHGGKNGSKSSVTTDLTAMQTSVLKRLFDWRDQVARDCDESWPYVCPNRSLLRLAMACPRTVTKLQSLLNPMPPLVLQHAHQVLECVSAAAAEADDETQDRPPSSAHFQPAKPEETTGMHPGSSPAAEGQGGRNGNGGGADTPSSSNRGMLSPVLGTEEMYQQAGWMTPSIAQQQQELPEQQADGGGGAISTSADDDDDPNSKGNKNKGKLLIDDANQNYRTNHPTPHSLLQNKGRGDNSESNPDQTAATVGLDLLGNTPEAAERASATADKVRQQWEHDTEWMRAYMAPVMDADDEDDEDDEEGNEGEGDENEADGDDREEEDEIPKSIRAIYKISNRNRRNKKIPSIPRSELETQVGEKMDVDTIEGAEALLKARGIDYLDGGGGGGTSENNSKRQKQNQPDEEEMEQAAPTQEEDIEFMQSIGWIKNKEEAEALKPRPRKDSEDLEEDGGDAAAAAGKGSDKDKIMDYSGNSSNNNNNNNNNIRAIYDPQGPVSTNPFFAGAAVAGNPNAFQSQQQQQQQRRNNSHRHNNSNSKRGGKGRSSRGNNNRHERPEKRDGKIAVYKRK